MDILRDRAYYQSQPFEVTLLQEGAIDQGGPYRDCLMQIVTDTQGENSVLTLFVPPKNESSKEFYIPNPQRKDPRYLNQFQFVGQLLGMCLRTGDSVPFYLAPIVWKWLVDEPLSHSDYTTVRTTFKHPQLLTHLQIAPAYHRVMKILSQNQENGAMMDEFGMPMFFVSISEEGEVVPLVEGGEEKQVTASNKDEFTRLIKQRQMRLYEGQLQAIKEGFLQVVSRSVVPLLTATELQERIAGKRDIDIDYLKQHTFYDGLTEDSPVVKYFWDALRSFTNEQRSMFLRFVWGRSTLPPSPEEFTEKFCIARMAPTSVAEELPEDQILPHAHTCAFQIELPQYSSEKIMKEKLLYAITNCRDIDLEWQSSTEHGFS